MIYGLNFNGIDVPDQIKKQFRPRIKVSPVRGDCAWLQGVAESPTERDLMVVAIDNGHRRIFVKKHHKLFGIYAS